MAINHEIWAELSRKVLVRVRHAFTPSEQTIIGEYIDVGEDEVESIVRKKGRWRERADARNSQPATHNSKKGA